jgi:benzoyl-CoA 2,3-dioxygenase component B
LFSAEPEPGRTIGFGDHMGAPAWQDVPANIAACCAG